tara:strand:- start:63 stop:1046 length:984 start_codon:yes stop_codon:yes gene_type:complete
MKCDNCGFDNNENKKFCTNCGFKIDTFSLKDNDKETTKEKLNSTYANKWDPYSRNSRRRTFNLPLLGILGLSLFGLVIGLVNYDENDNYVKSYEWVDDYLNSDGNCCNDKYFSIKTQKGKLLVLNDILELNPNDYEALKQKEKIDQEIAFREDNKYLKTFGDYSLLTNKVEFDVDFFKETSSIAYEVSVTKKGKKLENKFSFNCNGEKYDWEKEKWRMPRNKYEKAIIRNMCAEKRLDRKKMSFLKKSGWKQYPNYHWVDIKNWSEETSTEWKNYITNYHNPFKDNISEISVDCDNNTMTFFRNNKWSSWEKVKGSFKQIFADSPCN